MNFPTKYRFCQNGVLRTTLLPYEQQSLEKVLKQQAFQEGLFLASQNFHHKLQQFPQNNDIKLRNTVYGYLSRSRHRPTPFGLFAFVSPLNFQVQENEQAAILTSRPEARKTALDFSILFEIYLKLIQFKELREQVCYFANSTYYQAGDKIKYIDYIQKGLTLEYIVSQVSHDEILLEILDYFLSGHSFIDGINHFSERHAIEPEHLKEYFHLLIDYNLLISELHPNLTGKDYLSRIRKILRRVNDKTNNKALKRILLTLNQIQSLQDCLDASILNDASAYQKIAALLEELQINSKNRILFSVDAMRKSKPIQMRKEDTDNLLEAVELLQMLSTNQNSRIDRFKEEFYDRYQDEEIPLLIALDPDIGLGSHFTEELINTPLLNSYPFQEKGAFKFELSKVEHFLLKKLIQLPVEQGNCLYLDRTELEQVFSKKEQPKFANTLNLSFSVYKKGDESNLQLHGAFGPSAICMLNRFSHLSSNIAQLSTQLLEAETQATNAIQAEVLHISELRSANISKHPSLSSHEIPYFLTASSNSENVIHLNDLYLQIISGKLCLIHKKANKSVCIIPRLFNALNYDFKSSPLFRFFGDLQIEELGKSIVFNWGQIQNLFPSLPRVQYKNIILQPACQTLNLQQIRQLLNCTTNTNFLEKTSELKMPQKLYLYENGNPIFFDLNDPSSTEIFRHRLAKKTQVFITEYIDRDTSLVKDDQGKNYIHEILLPIVKREIYKEFVPTISPHSSMTQKTFFPGQEWLYAKLYCGKKVADQILCEAIAPLSQTLLQKEQIKSWYFIRYLDKTGFHLRLRFQSIGSIAPLIETLLKFTKPFIQKREIHKIKYDIYQREMQRYTLLDIEKNEHAFHINAEMVLQFLKTNQEERWLFAFHFLDFFLSSFKMDLPQKLAFVTRMSRSFQMEYGLINKQRRKNLSDNFRKKQTQLNRSLDWPNFSAISNPYHAYHCNLAEQVLASVATDEYADLKIDDFLWSHLHMFFIRLFEIAPRKQEAVLYYLAEKFYASAIGRLKAQQKTQHALI